MSMTDRNPYLLTLPQLLSAKKKIGKVAASFDPFKNTRKGFDSEYLTATEFREQLRCNFDLNLTNAELGALVVLCDRDGTGNVNTNDFLAEFQRLGKIEREKEQESAKKKSEELLRRKQIFAEKKVKKMTDRMKVVVKENWSEDDIVSAFRKISKVAVHYEKDNDANMKGFLDGGCMDIIQFKDQLHRNLDISLTASEFSALCHKLQSTLAGPNFIDCGEFAFHFFRLGREERERWRNRRRLQTKAILDKKQLQDNSITSHVSSLVTARLGQATEEDRKSAIHKLREVAVRHDPERCIGLQAFETKYMGPTAFREQIKLVFGIILTSKELKAMVELLDKDGNGCVSSAEFLSLYGSLGEEERLRIASQRKIADDRIKLLEEKRKLKIEQKGKQRCETRVLWPVLPEDENDPFEMEMSGDHGRLPLTNAQGNTRSRSSNSNSDAGAAWNPSSSKQSTRSASRSRKADLRNVFETNRVEEHLRKNKVSLVSLFPKASSETKDFILEIEAKEKEIRKMGAHKKKNKKTKSGQKGGEGAVNEYSGFRDTHSSSSQEQEQDYFEDFQEIKGVNNYGDEHGEEHQNKFPHLSDFEYASEVEFANDYDRGESPPEGESDAYSDKEDYEHDFS